MEKLNKKTLSFPSQIFVKAVAALTIVMTLAACGNGNGGNNNGGISGCQNCGGIINPVNIAMFNSQSSYMNIWPVTLQNMMLFVDGAYFVPGSSSSYNLYSGNIAVQGTMVVQAPIYSGPCSVPAGSYAIETYSMGTIQMGGNLQIPDLVAGPMRLRMSRGNSGSALYNMNGGTRWTGRLEIVAVNGIACGAFYSDMD